jgi:hypothetical protein
MHTQRRVMKYQYKMPAQEYERQKSYLAAYDSVPEVHCIGLFICSISELLSDPNPPTTRRFKRWLHFHKISQLIHDKSEVK